MNKKSFIKKIPAAPLYPDPHLPPTKEDFRETFQWKIFRIMAEFIEGYHFVADLKNSVTIFGSTSVNEKNLYYKEARKLGQLLAKNGYTVVTGGGPGIMEAANRGAFEVGGISVGMNIQLPEGQRMNAYVTHPIGFNYFFTRKVMLSFSAKAFIFFPGGYGTLDEFFEIITLLQTKKLEHPTFIPIITVGKRYWKPLYNWLKQEVYEKQKAVKPEDLKLFEIVDNAQEAFDKIKNI